MADIERTPMSPRQKDVYDFIQGFIFAEGYPPTFKEIGDGVGITSTNGVAVHIRGLERKGFLRRKKGGARALVLVP